MDLSGILSAANGDGPLGDFLHFALEAPLLLQLVAILLLAALLFFGAAFCLPAFRLNRLLKRFCAGLRDLKTGRIADPRAISIADERLLHLWQEYCDTLHEPFDALDPVTGVARPGRRRATVPAETIFNSLSVFEGRIHAEFFKHLPGLLTGLGIIGTFIGLIHGLGAANESDGGLNTTLLINSVKEAFYVSAGAIILAMVVTFVEKWVVSNFHRRVEQLSQLVDSLYTSGAGEEYLSRLVTASEESASQARILKDALVGDLRRILEEMTQRQIDASLRQQEELTRQFGGLLEHGVGMPLEQVAERLGGSSSQSLQDLVAALGEKFERVASGVERMGLNQGEQIAAGLGDSMATFAARLDQMLGGQIGQAKELQGKTIESLENAIKSIETMANKIGLAGEGATSAMSEQVRQTLTELAEHQRLIGDSIRTVTDELRASVSNAHTVTSQGVETLLAALGGEVGELIGRLHGEAETHALTQQGRMDEFTEQAKASLAELTGAVKAQTSSIEEAASAMRGAIADLGTAVNSNIARMAEGAGEIRLASEQFAGSGRAVSDVLDRSRVVAGEFIELAQVLSTSAQDVRSVISDYRSARETFGAIVAGLNETIASARRDASMTSEMIQSMEAAVQKLVTAQSEADTYLAKVSEVIRESHGSFTNSMVETLRQTNTEFHKHLGSSVSLLASSIEDLDHALGNLPSSANRSASK